jgi:5-methyltetrahydropteroyltriglutamate--homocysteine methyltransferase
MKRSTDRILTTHTGSLARPHDLLDLMKAKESGAPYDHEGYVTRVRTSVAEVVRKQAESGVDVVNDGEQSKTGFSNYIRDRLTGFEPVKGSTSQPVRTGGREAELFPEYYEEYYKVGYFTTRVADNRPLVCTGPISYRQESVQRDIENLKAALQGLPTGQARGRVEEAFIPATTPILNLRNEYYKTQDEYIAAVSDAIREEYKAIVDAGFLLQIDAPGLPRPPANAPSEEEGRKQMERRIEALNYALRDIPEDKIRFHTCFGVNMGPRVCDDTLADMIGPMLKIKAAAYSFEAANPRHMHEYHVFEDVKLPEGKTIIPGMVTHAHNIVEHPELIAEMIVNYAKLVGRENVIVGNDCGFSSQAVYQPEVDARVAWAKFQALSEGAALASKKLWGK